MKKIVAFDLNKVKAKHLIAEIAKDSSRVFITDHARKRMNERKITDTQIHRCLGHGQMKDEPFRNQKGNWQVTLETITAGERVVVVAAIEKEVDGGYIVVITAHH